MTVLEVAEDLNVIIQPAHAKEILNAQIRPIARQVTQMECTLRFKMGLNTFQEGECIESPGQSCRFNPDCESAEDGSVCR